MDGQGNINVNVNAPKNMSFTAGENISITAGENVNVNARNNISETAGVNIVQSATADYSLFASNIMEVANGKRTSQADEVIEEGKAKVSQTQETTIFNAKQSVKSNSGEKGTNH